MLNDDYREILQLLSDAGAEFLVVGAYAMAAHGYPRATGDIDILINPTSENASKVYGALQRFGAPLVDLTERDLAREGMVYQIGVAPMRIDVLTSITGVSFDQAMADRVVKNFEGQSIPFISPRNLILNKKAIGRPRYIEDAEVLRKHCES